jgi:hypothetical protein
MFGDTHADPICDVEEESQIHLTVVDGFQFEPYAQRHRSTPAHSLGATR